MSRLTADTITDDQIKSIRVGASAAGRDWLVRFCDAALIGDNAYSPARARQVCADEINDANAALDRSVAK